MGASPAPLRAGPYHTAMQKIETLFLREQVGKRAFATETVNPECAWVLDGEGIATEKIDGTCCLVRGGVLYKRHELKEGKPRPDGWFHWNFADPSPTGHGWAPIGGGSEDAYHREAWETRLDVPDDGTYELIGPKVQSNPYRLERHRLSRHGDCSLPSCPREFNALSEWLMANEVEGIVWHHPDGRMAKLKRRDFGIPWPVKELRVQAEPRR